VPCCPKAPDSKDTPPSNLAFYDLPSQWFAFGVVSPKLVETSIHVVGTNQRGHGTAPEFPPTALGVGMMLTSAPCGDKDGHS